MRAEESTRRGTSKIFLKVSFTVLAFLVMLLLAEAILSLLNYHYSPIRIQVLNRTDKRHQLAFKEVFYVYDPGLIWRPRRSIGPFNSQGYRGEELPEEKKSGTLRIFAFGDSNTIGWLWPADAPNYPLFLERLLNEGLSEKKYVVTNAAAHGYSSYQGLKRFRESLRFKPDIALISFGANDATELGITDEEFCRRDVRKLHIDELLINYKTGQLVLSLMDKLLVKRAKPVPRVSLEDYEKNIREMIRLARKSGITPILLTRPFRLQENEQDRKFPYNEATLRIGKQDHVPVLDLFLYFKDKSSCFMDSNHYNEDGMEKAAALISSGIRPSLKK
ncbi:MAG: SGNH/GDSL hydrolase family protein [Candidatus Eremiobacteraeota bacterium]|nr:SGNH/GDSL hydrolase family protein [Candidatus Eremiobacteraeota bacterium]